MKKTKKSHHKNVHKKRGHRNTSHKKEHYDEIYEKMNCSPNPNNKKNYSCYSDSSLLKMKKYWNMRHPRDKITATKPKEIWMELKRNMSNSCNRESCWLRSKFMQGNTDAELLNYTFAPKAPQKWKVKPDEWLSSLDIESVMKQYEKYYKCFEFLGPSPIDYDHHKLYGECVWEELCNLNISDQIKRHKNKIGIILNTHPHNKSGEHWISIFINIKKKEIIYFDSNGNKPPSQVVKLMNEIKAQGQQLGINFTISENDIEHQETESECGMYCLYFIVEMLKDKDLNYFLENKIDDGEVFKLRKKYFNVI